jgi:hypothetical protein
VLVQAKRLPGDAFDAVAGDRAAEGLGRNGEPEACLRAVIGQGRQTEILVSAAPALQPDLPEFGGLVQALVRLEPEVADGPGNLARSALRTETLAALGTAAREQTTSALGGHAGAEAVCTGAVQVARIECTFHSDRIGHAMYAKGGKGT